LLFSHTFPHTFFTTLGFYTRMNMLTLLPTVLLFPLAYIQAATPLTSEWDKKFARLEDWASKNGSRGLHTVRSALFDYGGLEVRGLASTQTKAAGAW